jgi:hypothetical protein
MSALDVELCLAALYTQAEARRAFLHSADSLLDRFSLSTDERDGLRAMDRAGLVLAGNSFSAKRAKQNRWMHTVVKAVQQFDALVTPQALAEVRSAVAQWGRPQAAPASPRPLLRRLDFFEWEADSHHNREHMLAETPGLEALVGLWVGLQAGVLMNHHLLRCYAVSAACPAKQEIHREHPRPGTSMTYVCLTPDSGTPAPCDLVLHYENRAEVLRAPLAGGRVVVMPADVLHRFERTATCEAADPLLLVFKSLAAIQ